MLASTHSFHPRPLLDPSAVEGDGLPARGALDLPMPPLDDDRLDEPATGLGDITRRADDIRRGHRHMGTRVEAARRGVDLLAR